MSTSAERRSPGEVRDAIRRYLQTRPSGASVAEITEGVCRLIGNVSASSIRSYLCLNTPKAFARTRQGHYLLLGDEKTSVNGARVEQRFCTQVVGKAEVVHADCMAWLKQRQPNSIHAVVTDPPYGLVEYSSKEQEKLRKGVGGIWRIPPSFDGASRSPLPRFTVLSPSDLSALEDFFTRWVRLLIPSLVPGANVVVASNPLLSFVVAGALASTGLERRGEIVRLSTTMRGGDRPKGAHHEFSGVSVMPRSMWEPWLVFRKPLEGRVQDNLRKWRTGGFRRPSPERPFGDVVRSSPARKEERAVAPHPSLKPQAFLRELVRGVLPLGEGTVLDPFCGSGSTLAAAEAVNYSSIGVESDPIYYAIACQAIPRLTKCR